MNASPACPRGTRILVRGVNWLGDAVMTTPALLRLRQANPNATITLLTPEKLADLWQNHPALNKVLGFGQTEGPFAVARRLKPERFDVALVFPNSFRSALEIWLARIPSRLGYPGQHRRWLLSQAVPRPAAAIPMHKRTRAEIRRLTRGEAFVSDEKGRRPTGATDPPAVDVAGAHHSYQYLHLAAQLGGSTTALAPQLFVSQTEVQAFLDRIGLKAPIDCPLFGLNPGAEYGPAKRWPAEKFTIAAREIQQRTGCRWLIFGGKGDLELATGIAHGIEAGPGKGSKFTGLAAPLNLAGRTSLRELCCGLKACHVVLTNDTGPMHVAAAVGTPVVVPFGSTSPDLTGPGVPGHGPHRVFKSVVPCAPCFLRDCPIDLRCMHSIEVAEIVQAVVSVAGGGADPARLDRRQPV